MLNYQRVSMKRWTVVQGTSFAHGTIQEIDPATTLAAGVAAGRKIELGLVEGKTCRTALPPVSWEHPWRILPSSQWQVTFSTASIFVGSGWYSNLLKPIGDIKGWLCLRQCLNRNQGPNLVGGDWNHGILWLSIYWEFHHPNWLS